MNVALALRLGLAAGAVGTVVLTLSETIEQRLTGREDSRVPGQVGAALTGRKGDEAAAGKLNTPVHWMHGTTMGAARGALALTGLGPVAATAAHYAVVWGGDVTLYRGLGIAPWPWKWQKQELATDLFHKGVYAIATGVAFKILRNAAT
ncbi:hypothetical protein [Streptomyces sp. Wb2n-11]|uniref:hypothetical protein n=1 Tax=Streptomyces sp. Wb2n-11 TaxID=1030533 RepID=UPI000AA6C29B|nr:hypothetical protein [Streptomyces sp. Wb2n-11]